MHSIHTRVSFEAAHRLYNVDTYSKECRENIHGHSYKVDVVVGRDELNKSGMVMDFKKLKTILKELEEMYDHSCILSFDDPLLEPIKANCKKVITASSNPTAEWMAEKFFNWIQDHLVDETYVVSVAVQETENNIAIYERG